MATIYDMLELNGLPAAGFILGTPGSGADVEFLLTETTAEVTDDHYDNMLSDTVQAGFYSMASGIGSVLIDGATYSASGLYEVAYEVNGQSYSGFIVQATPNGGGAARTFFLPEDGLGATEIGQITILSMNAIGFMDADLAAVDDAVQFLVCFAAGTRLATPSGPRAVEDLAEGDLVSTLDDGDLPVLWVEETRVARDVVVRDTRLQLIQIDPGAFAPGIPARALRISRQHRVAVRGRIVRRMFGTEEVLVAAKDCLGLPGVHPVPPYADIHLFHLLLPCHSILLAEGLAAESLWLGTQTLPILGAASVQEMRRRLYAPQSPARMFVSGGAAQRLIQRHAANRRSLWEGDAPLPTARSGTGVGRNLVKA